MKIFSTVAPGFLVILAISLGGAAASVNSGGAPSGRTGAPGALTCADTGCHGGNPLNADGGAVTITAPAEYQPGTPVDLVVRVERPGAKRFGFSITVRNIDNQMVGTWEILDQSGTAFSEFGLDPTHVTHSVAPRVDDQTEWMLRWNPPATDVGNVTFYAAGNAANGAQGSAGDFIYTTSHIVAATTGTGTETELLPRAVTIDGWAPHPLGQQGELRFETLQSGQAQLTVYDMMGRRIWQEDTSVGIGPQAWTIDSSRWPAGTYAFRLDLDGHSSTGTMLVSR